MKIQEKNILLIYVADILTLHGLVIEFQHSHIHMQERTSRESFYQNMAWVVDGTRLRHMYSRFLKGKQHFLIIRKGIFGLRFPEEYFPSEWLDNTVPVIFDFQEKEKNSLYCLFPRRIGINAVIAEISRYAFTRATIDGEWSGRAHRLMKEINQVNKEQQTQIDQQKRRRMNAIMNTNIPK